MLFFEHLLFSLWDTSPILKVVSDVTIEFLLLIAGSDSLLLGVDFRRPPEEANVTESHLPGPQGPQPHSWYICLHTHCH